MKILGIKKLKAALGKREKWIAGGFSQGLRLGGLIIEGASIKQTPIEFGNLRRSHRTTHKGRGFATKVYITVQMSYAIYVHEILHYKHAPGTNAKFLEKAAREQAQAVGELVRKSARNTHG